MKVKFFIVIIDVHDMLINLCKFGGCGPCSIGCKRLTKNFNLDVHADANADADAKVTT